MLLLLRMLTRLLIISVLMFGLNSCHIFRAIRWGAPDTKDQDRMPSVLIEKSDFPFAYSKNQKQYSEAWSKYIQTNFLHPDLQTDAFLIIKNDTIIYEYYSKDKNESTRLMGFSLSKSFVGTAIGIALDEGLIASEYDPVCKYLPELNNRDSSISEITIKDLLDMRAFFEYDEQKFGLNAPITKLYYGKKITNELRFLKKSTKSENYKYQNINTQLLSLIIERVSKLKFYEFFQKKIWSKIGSEFDAQWIIDNKKDKNAKTFFGFSATARDFAKLGTLYIKGGKINGNQIISESWVNASTNPDTLFKREYNNHWWANNVIRFIPVNNENALRQYIIDNAIKGVVEKSTSGNYQVRSKGDSFMGYGLYEQYLYVNPSKNIIILRLGSQPKNGIDLEKSILGLVDAL